MSTSPVLLTASQPDPRPIRAAMYLRVSTRPDKRDDDTTRQLNPEEIENELGLLREFCGTRGLSVIFESDNASKTCRTVGRPRLKFSRDQVVELRRDGLSWRQIGRTVGASIASVRRAYAAASSPGALLCPEVPEHA